MRTTLMLTAMLWFKDNIEPSIAIECVGAQQGVLITNFWRRNALTEQWKHWPANLRLKAQIGSGYLV